MQLSRLQCDHSHKIVNTDVTKLHYILLVAYIGGPA